MKNRLLPALFALVMVLGMLPLTAFAADGKSIADALGTAGEDQDYTVEGSVYTLQKDVTLKAGEYILVESSAVTIDLNGHTLSRSDVNQMFYVKNGGTLTITDSQFVAASVEKDFTVTPATGGKIEGYGNIDTIYVAEGGTLNVEGGTIVGKNNAISMWSMDDENPVGGTVNISGGYIYSEKAGGSGSCVMILEGTLNVPGTAVLEGKSAPAISGNGSSSYAGLKSAVNITGGSVIATGCNGDGLPAAIYQPQGGTLTVSGGVVAAIDGVAIAARAGTVSVTGGTVAATGSGSGAVGDAGNDFNKGDAIAFDSNSGYPDAAATDKIRISGGTIDGKVEVVNGSTLADADYAKMDVSGGTFSEEVNPKYLANGLKYQAKDDDNMYTYHATSDAARDAAGEDGQIAAIDGTGDNWDTAIDATKYFIIVDYDTAVGNAPTFTANTVALSAPYAAEAGDVIVITATAANPANYTVDTITVTDSNKNNVTLIGSSKNTLEMPASDVTIKITYKPNVAAGDVTWEYSQEEGKAFGKITIEGLTNALNYVVQFGKSGGTHVIIDLGAADASGKKEITVLDGTYDEVQLYTYTNPLASQPVRGNDIYEVPISKKPAAGADRRTT
ncbi:MAG: hypothetical protein J1E06_10015 [Acutalibacter sp.]|nr:hypothetical protein [Acutalibacter sp.]